jgi:large subunit ribosomal protein L4
MTIKKFEYSIYNSSIPNEILRKNFFSLKVADKAKYIVHRALKTEANNKTQYTSSTKTKDEVRGGGRKPWKQKGTGRARSGSSRSPIWRGGGITFGPRPKSVYNKINKKEKNLALTTLIYNKQNQFLVFDNLELKDCKTINFLKMCNIFNLTLTEKILIILKEPNKNLQLSLRNLSNFEYILANQLNLTEITKANKIILDEKAFEIIKETYCD